MTEQNYQYPGRELELFALAINWKAYWSAFLRPYIRGTVIEVGSGTGENIPLLLNDKVSELLSIEPDSGLYEQLENRVKAEFTDDRVTTRQCVLADITGSAECDCVVYIDVLEHIEHDLEELQHAAAHLKSGGFVIVLSPAHQSLFSKFDAAIGHFRRYDRAMIEALDVPNCTLECTAYLDAVGMMASFANRLLLRQSYPTAAQIRTWDRCMVPASRWLDPLLGHRLGKTIIAVWKRL